LKRLVRERDAVRVDRGPAEDVLLVAQPGRDGVEHPGGGAEDLRADPVAGKR
jgi:hypothetical protein